MRTFRKKYYSKDEPEKYPRDPYNLDLRNEIRNFSNEATKGGTLTDPETIEKNVRTILTRSAYNPINKIIQKLDEYGYPNPSEVLALFFDELLNSKSITMDQVYSIIDDINATGKFDGTAYTADSIKNYIKTPTNENKMNNKLRQLIRESINEYIRDIEESGNMAATEAKMKACQEAIELREKKLNMEGIDEAYHDMLDKGKMKELGNEIKALKKSLAKYEKQLEKLKNKGKKSEEPKEETEKEIVDEVNIDENLPEAGPELEETELNESFLHMQKLAGLITETEYKKKTNQ